MKKDPVLAAALPLIRPIRGQRVILDCDLARLYGVATKQLNQQFRRNRRRFPDDFAFQLTLREASAMRSQNVTASGKRNRGKPPVAYTEHGAVMAANVLKSERAATMSVEVVRAFIRLRKAASSHENIALMLRALEATVVSRLDRHDKEIETLFAMVTALLGDAVGRDARKKTVGTA